MKREKGQNDRIRYNLLTIITYAIGIVLLLQLFNLQIIHGAEYRETSNSRLTRETPVRAARGNIKDRTGIELVRTDTGYSVEIYSTKVTDQELNTSIERFISILEKNKDEFVDNLLYMADELKKKGVKVVFITSIARRRFVSGKLQDTHGDWTAAMKYAAWKAGVPCIDMTIPTMVGIAMMGDEESKRYFMNFGPGCYANYPEGKEDDTHLSPEGAEWIARLVAERLMDVEDCCESY